TYVLADVAAEEPVADRRTKIFGDRAPMLDRQVRDAATGVEDVRPDERLGRARVQARATRSATVGLRAVNVQLGGGQHDADEEIRAEIGPDEVGVLSDPAEPGGGREVTLEHGAGVDRGTAERTLARRPLDEACESVEPWAHDVAIVTPAGVTGDPC